MAGATSSCFRPGPISPSAAFSSARPPKQDLVEFLALLVDAENADVADMVVAAGIDAAGHVDVQRADFFLEFRVGEHRLDFVARPRSSAHWPGCSNRDPGTR
jgi:hypothetical protein